MTLDNLRVPFITSGTFKILSFRSKDPEFKTDPGVIPSGPQRAKAGITVVNTPFRHDDMRDTGSKEAKASIEAMLDKFLTDTDNSAVAPVEPSQHRRPGAYLRIGRTRPELTPRITL